MRIVRALLSTALVLLAAGCGDDPVAPEVEDLGIALTLKSQQVKSPSNVTVLLQARTSDGEPLAGLTINSFEISEDGDPISQFEAPRAFAPKPGKFVARTYLVLDLSGSVVSTLPELKSAARAFINATLPAGTPSGDTEVGIWWFDGAAQLHSLAALSQQREPLLLAIDSITSNLSRDISTNLNGAVIEAVEMAGRKATEDKQKQVSSSNSVVVFTDGTDRAARRTEQAALGAVEANKANVSVYTIGLGGEIKAATLQAFGINGFFAAGNVTELVGAFEKVGASIRKESNSFYLFDYCSPKRAGTHQLKIRAIQGDISGSITTAFSAQGFTGGCQAGS